MSPKPEATLPPLSTLLRNQSCTSTGSSSSPPPSSPLTPPDGPIASYFAMETKRRAAPPAPLTTLPSLTSSIPLTRKPSDERRNISALLNDREPHNMQDHEQQHSAPTHGSQAPPPHPSPSQLPHPQHAQHYNQQQQQHPSHHPNQPPPPPPPHEHHPSHDSHHPYPPPPPHHHQHPGSAAPLPPPPMSAPLMPTGPPPMAHGRGYFSPPPPSSSRPSYDYRSPPQHPYGRPDMGRRHSYHPFYDYPVYEMGVPLPYHHPAYMAMGPFDGGMGARGPISRTTKACDACRSRKVRCDAGGMPGATGTCSRCRESGRVCVYTATQKKRGPTPGRPSRSQSHNVNDGGRRESPEASASMSSAGQHAPDRRQTWSNSSRPPPTPSGTLRHSMPGYIPHSAGLPPTAPWGYPYGYDERPARPHAHPHSYRSPPAGPRSAPLVERDRPPPSGWGEPQGQGQGPQGGPPGPPLPGPQQQPPLPPAPAHLGAPATQAPPVGPGTPHHPHEPRQPPLFDSNYSLHPHPASAWPHNPPRREYSYAPDFERRSHSPPSVRTLAPLRRD